MLDDAMTMDQTTMLGIMSAKGGMTTAAGSKASKKPSADISVRNALANKPKAQQATE